MNTSASSPASAGSASPLKPAASAQLSFASETPTGSATSPTTGPECPSSGMSTTWTLSSAQLWPTASANHSSSPQASPASRPVPPASARAAQMTAGSGRRLSAWLNASDPAGACLKTLLDSPRWHSPLRSLAWTLKGYGGVPDAPCAKSSEDLTFWDMTSRETGMASLGFRLCRLSQSEVSTGETGCGSSQGAEMWITPTVQDSDKATLRWREDHQNNLSAKAAAQLWPTSTTRDWKGSYTQEAMTRKDGKTRDDQLPTVAEMHNGTQPERPAELWTTATVDDANNVSRASGEFKSLVRDANCQTGPPPSSNAEPTASRGQLNPDFVCWLMGYPAGWLNYVDLETPLSRKSPRKSSAQ